MSAAPPADLVDGLRAPFGRSITAGDRSGVNDGAAVLLLEGVRS
jgi:hypothetical protein